MTPKNNNINTLLFLLADTNKIIYEGIKKEFLSIGLTAIPYLTELEAKTDHCLVKSRCKEIIQKINSRRCIEELKLWIIYNDPYNWDFIYIFSEFNDPHFNKDIIEEKLNFIETEFLKRYPVLKIPEQTIESLRKFIFSDLGFQFDFNALSLDNLLIPRFLKKRRGSSFLFSMLYARLGKACHFDILPVTFPENIVLVLTEKHEIKEEWKLLFYINPANGETFSRRRIELFLQKNNMDINPSFFAPSATSRIAFLYFRQLSAAYKQTGNLLMSEQLTDMINTILAFDPEHINLNRK